MDLSVVIPLFNEEESLPELYTWIQEVCHKNNISFEVIFIDDGSTDSSWKVITTLSKQDTRVKAIKFRRNYGKSAALNVGFSKAQGEVVITMDADLQDSPDEIPELMHLIQVDGYDLISGWKAKRYDPLSKTIPTKLFNWATRKLSDIQLNDFNCGLKAYRNEVVKCIEVYGEMHRYIPVLAKKAGFSKIGEKVVQHRERKYGTTKFGLDRFVNGFLDLLSITFMGKFGKRPMHFFGLWGTLFFFLGFLFTFYLISTKLFSGLYLKLLGWKYEALTERPLFFIALVLMLIGSQFFLAGFLGELITRNAPDRNQYLIGAELNL